MSTLGWLCPVFEVTFVTRRQRDRVTTGSFHSMYFNYFDRVLLGNFITGGNLCNTWADVLQSWFFSASLILSTLQECGQIELALVNTWSLSGFPSCITKHSKFNKMKFGKTAKKYPFSPENTRQLCDDYLKEENIQVSTKDQVICEPKQ